MRSTRPVPASSTVLAIVAAAFPASAQVVNAPVAPDTIYVVRKGARSGLSVIDLNGFGASTGDPTYDPTTLAEGNSNYPNNPNLRFQGALLRPPLQPGTSTLDGGSAGVFTLTKDSLLDDLHVQSPTVASISDLMLGHPLDTSFNDGPAPFGCLAGGGNLCAVDGKKLVEVSLGGPNSLMPFDGTRPRLNLVQGGGNPISWAPHPNPPPLLATPLCQRPYIGGQEPTSVESILQALLTNLLGPGDPFGDPALGIPPTGLLASEQNAFFVGPGVPEPLIQLCPEYQYRQQVGHWMYVADRERGEVVALDSNRLRVLRRIAVPDPTEFAMSPDLALLAVTSSADDSVSFIDIDPKSSTFHQVVRTTPVGRAPRGIAWDPGNEDVLVCNEGDDSLSIVSAATLSVRRVVRRLLDRPFAVAITQRQSGFGFQRDVYFAYVLNRDGKVCLFESGPNGVNGWGYDDIVWRTPYAFRSPRAIQPDPLRITSGVWIAHEDPLDPLGNPTGMSGGAVSNLVIDSALVGPITLLPGDPPHLRYMQLRVVRSIGRDQLSGVPLDLAFDDQRNLGALPDFPSAFSAREPAPLNGKSQVRQLGPAGQIVNTSEPKYLFVPIRGAGVVDVIRLSDGVRIDTNAHQPGIQSIPAVGAAVVMDYFRQ
jgi:YVTN family beta-propeller protein